MIFGTLVFYAYVHEWACHINFNPWFNKYWGLSDGERLERLWSFLSALVLVLRISTRLHRLLSIYWRTRFYKTKLNDGIGKWGVSVRHNSIFITDFFGLSTVTAQWLRKRRGNALKVLRQAQATLTYLSAVPNSAEPGQTYSQTFLREQWVSEREAYASKEVALHKQKLELGWFLSLQDEYEEVSWVNFNIWPIDNQLTITLHI